ncbi:MAG: 30S ribosomal protein S18 [Labilithrix sp.]
MDAGKDDDYEDNAVVNEAARGTARRGRKLAQRLNLTRDHEFDYKDPQALEYFITERGKIVPRRVSGLSARQQRSLALAVKRARNIALLPFTDPNPTR